MKIYSDASAAMFDVQDGATVMSGGFGLCGIAENCIGELVRRNVKNLKVISNNIGNSGRGLAALLSSEQIAHATCSYIGGNPELEKLLLAGKIKVDLVPQGTFVERIRAAGLGIRGFYTPTSYGTPVAAGKEVKQFDRPCVLEFPLPADFAIIKAQKGDTYGNLWFKETARNFSPLMAMAAKTTIVEVEELVSLGEIAAEDVHLPGIFVQRIFKGTGYKNDIEILKLQQDPSEPSESVVRGIEKGWTKEQMATEVAGLFFDGCSVNLGIGLPTLVAEHVPLSRGIMIHSENGVLGVSGRPTAQSVSPTLINAGKETVSVREGSSFFDSSLSFGMIRGGHIDFSVLGAMEVDADRNLANWMIPGRKVTGMGGAMDLVNGAKQVVAMLNHLDPSGQVKLVQKCTLPLTGLNVVDVIVTNFGIFAPANGRYRIHKLAPNIEPHDLGIAAKLLD